MNKTIASRKLRRMCLLLLLAPLTGRADIFKWVDADGRTHFSERKTDAPAAQAVSVNGGSAAASAASRPPAEYWHEQDRQFRQRQLERANAAPPATSQANNRPAAAGDSQPNANDPRASSCKLAKAVVDGNAIHRNGRAIDDRDREIATEELRTLCR